MIRSIYLAVSFYASIRLCGILVAGADATQSSLGALDAVTGMESNQLRWTPRLGRRVDVVKPVVMNLGGVVTLTAKGNFNGRA
jgi:hypothetical protein